MVSRAILPEAAGEGRAAPEGVSFPVPAPTLGLNTRDHFTNLQPNEARALVNWLPDQGVCRVRPGYELYCDTASANPVKTLQRWQSGTTQKLLAATDGLILEVYSGSPISAGSGYTNDLWSTDYFNGYAFGVNGADTPWSYNGTFNSSTGFSGVTLANLRTVKGIGSRLWFTVIDSGDVYYGPTLGITGTLNIFQLSQISDGGICLGCFPWLGNVVFCMSTGQVLVYQGDPAQGTGAQGFTLVAKYYAPPLVGYDAAVKMGGELVLLTQSGLILMDVVAAGLAFELDALGNWSKIYPSWTADFKTYGSNAGWFGKWMGGLVYCSIPDGTNLPKTYIFNTRNQGWTTYQGLPTAAAEFIGNTVFLADPANGKIYTHAGHEDNGMPISAVARPAFSYLGDPMHAKQATLQRPNMITSGNLSGIFSIDTDYVDSPIAGATAALAMAGGSTPWGSNWGSQWSTESVNQPIWLGAAGEGRVLAPACITFSDGDVSWFSTDLLGVPLGPM